MTARAGGARVLLVDDNAALVDNLREILEDEGHAVAIADSGPAALRALEAAPFDLVISDMRMPGMTGLDVLRRIHTRWPGLPVIIMTAYERDSLLEQAQSEGALGVLSKPLDLGYVVALVESLAPPRADVLVVEDDAALRVNLCESLLADAGVTPHPAPDLAAARRLLATVAVRAAVIDVRLPDGDGRALGAEIRAGRGGDQVRVIYITGHGRELEDTLRAVVGAGQVHLLEKPFSPGRLLALIEDVAP